MERRRMSVFVELNALLYIGVLAFAGGLAWTIRTYSARWGDAAVLLLTTTLLIAGLGYCFIQATPYSRQKVDAPSLVFDYVLYLGCLIFAVELGYIEYRFNLLQDRWDYYLLASAVLYFVLAYRFDNRFVLSLGIATLGGWFGVRVAQADLLFGNLARTSALAYGTSVALIGGLLSFAGIKRHFLDTCLHLATSVVLAAMVSGAIDGHSGSLWLPGLIVLATATVACGVRFRRFAFVVYGTWYGYIGISGKLLDHLHGSTEILSYFVISATAVIVGLVLLSRFGREE